MVTLPTGTVAFLVSAIEGSMRLQQQLGDRYADVLSECRRLHRTASESHDGGEVDIHGDAWCFAFPRAKMALSAAVAALRAINRYPWPGGINVRVRMSLHARDPLRVNADPGSVDVRRAISICAAGHGGQILASHMVRDLVADDLPKDTSLRDLGEHRLKDLTLSQRLFQVMHPHLPSAFPPLRSLGALPNNLPIQLTSFIGREREIAQVKGFLSTTRLLTLTGAGGVGKTRLAFQVAAEVLGDFPDGAWVVDLAPLRDPGLVPYAVASVMSVSEQPDRMLTNTLVDALRHKALLLILDNCEHLQSACERLADALLRGCEHLRILASSRVPLGLPGETLWRVPSLSLPDPQGLSSLDHVEQHEAIGLFVERARSGQPGFALTSDNAAAVAHVCQRLDGIPLAIELAAARTRVLAIEQIAARLDDRFRLLTGGNSSGLPRHQTLRATMDWSYGLLGEKERILLRRLSVFAGGWTLEAAEAICSGDGIETIDILDLLTQLVDKSLVVMEIHSGEARYRLLETVRQYAQDRLHEAGDTDNVRQRHRDWYLHLAEQAAPELGGPQQVLWFARLEREHDNLRVALEWSKLEKGGAEAGLRLTGALRGFWARRGHWREGREWLEAALVRSTEVSPLVSSGALLGATHFARRRGDYGLATTLGQKGLALCRALGDKDGTASFLSALSIVEALQGDFEGARALCEETVSLSRERGNKSLMGTALTHLGSIALYQHDYERATAMHTESLALFREIGDKWNIAFALHGLAVVALRRSDYERAAALFTDSLILCKEVGNRWISEECLEGFARVASATGHYPRAARLFGAAEVLRETLDLHRSRADQAYHDKRVASTRAALGDVAFDAASAEGQAMTLHQAIEYALTPAEAASPQTERKKRRAGTHTELLTLREREVAALVARGLTNRDIAARLVVTERTAETHIQNILNKLGFTSRAQIAAWVVEHELRVPADQ